MREKLSKKAKKKHDDETANPKILKILFKLTQKMFINVLLVLILAHTVRSFQVRPSCYHFDSKLEEHSNRSLNLIHNTPFAKDR